MNYLVTEEKVLLPQALFICSLINYLVISSN